MIKDTMSFTFIIILVLFISAFAFTTRFSNLDDDDHYRTIWSSMRYLFDIMVSNYQFDYKENF